MGWEQATLGALCETGKGEVKTGPFGSQLHQSDYSHSGTPVVMPKDIIGGRVSEISIARVEYEHVERLSHHRLQIGDIVYGRRGDIGRCALVTSRENGWLCGTGCLRIRLGKSLISPRFLFYYLNHPDTINWIYNQAVGATMPNLNTAILKAIPVRYPPRQIQDKIVSILSAYDDLIENNTRRIEILEEMARRLYEEWFVHFRFPGHEKVRFKESELGKIPAEWEYAKLKDCVDLLYGKALKKTDRTPGNYPVYGSSGVVGTHSKPLVKGPGIIVGRKGNVGTVFWTEDDFYPIDTVYYVKTDLPLEYVFFNLQSQQFINNDAAVPGLNREQAYSLPFLKPSPEILEMFVGYCKPIYKLVRQLYRKNFNLQDQRDLLLPKLISGEIAVADVP